MTMRAAIIVLGGLLLPVTAEAWTKEGVAECMDRAAKAASATKAAGGDDKAALARGADAMADILSQCVPEPGEPEQRGS
jgi:hypothetical protein